MLRTAMLTLIVTLSLILGAAGLALASQYPVDGIPDLIPPADAARLKTAGVTTTQVLLQRGATSKERKELSKVTKIKEERLRGFVEAADLMRTRGIGPKMVRLLGHLKVHTVADLRKQDPDKLAGETEKAKPKFETDLKEKLPDKTTFADWIAQAKILPAVLK